MGGDGILTIGCGFLIQDGETEMFDIIINDGEKNDILYCWLYHDGTIFLGIKSKCIHGFISDVDVDVYCCSEDEDEFRLSEDEIKKLTDFIEKHNLEVTSKLKFLCNIFPQ